MGTLAAFAADLAGRTDPQLLRLFALRPDAITPPVANFADLASRLSSTASIDAALDQLSLPELDALAAVPRGVDLAADLAEDLAELDSLHELALVLRLAPLPFELGVQQLPAQKYDGGTHLFRPLTAVGLALGRGAGAGASRVASGAGAGAGAGVPRVGAGGGSGDDCEIPGSAFPDLPVAPKPRLTHVSPAMRDNAVGSAVETLLRTMSALLDVVGDAGIKALRGGAIGVRPVRELSKTLDIGAESMYFYLELAAAAQLLTFDEAARNWRTDEGRKHEGCTDEACTHETSWRSLERPDQWLVLVRSWLSNVRPPSALIRPLAPYDPPRQARQWRRQVTSVLANLAALAADPVAADSAAPDIRSLMDALIWHHPRQTAALGHEIPALLHEMEWLGITGAGALSSAVRAAVSNQTVLATASMRALLPAPVDHFVLQGDLTAIAPGFLVPELASTLKLMAVPEGRGAAGIFRFSQHSLEAAAAGGMSHSAILDFLKQRSSTAVPQSLEFLIAEVFRKRPNGYSSAESAPRMPQPQPPAPSPSAAQRWTAQPPQPGNGVVHDESDALVQLKRLRSQPVWANDGVGESGPALVMEELRQAVEHGRTLSVQAVDSAGEIEELLLHPVSLEAGMLRARLPATGRERWLSIHRIISAVTRVQATETDHAGASTSRERHD